MQSVFDTGDTVTVRLDLGVDPDGTTQVTVAVMRPDGTYLSPPLVPSGPTGQEYVAQFQPTIAGDWVAIWTVAGTGAGVESKVFNVLPLPAARTRPAWSPFLSQVAQYVPLKTLDMTPGSTELYLGTFTGVTQPRDGNAQRIVDGAVTSILAVVPTIAPSLEDLARLAAALRAAADIELGWPQRTTDTQTYTALDGRANAELARLKEAAANTGGGVEATVPYWQFPDPREGFGYRDWPL